VSAAIHLIAWLGGTLLLSSIPRVQRTSLTARLLPYLPGRSAAPHAATDLRATVEARVVALGDALARLGGISESTARRLDRAHRPIDVATFRVRQAGWSAFTAAAIGVFAPVLGLDPAAALGAIAAGAVLTALIIEQALVAAGTAHQERVATELPVIEEQLGMLLAAGWSIGSALTRLADRSSGAVARDLARVVRRVRQGLDHRAALEEWSDLVDVPSLHRLVRLLLLERHGGDLSSLVADEARSARLELHRRTIEALERRAQLVWVPVTVATLLPGVVFLAIPFLEAMRLFSA
jgi:Flp pilus assembly protein TadB